MDADRFDSLTKALITGVGRRRLVSGLLSGTFAGLLADAESEARPKKVQHKRQERDRVSDERKNKSKKKKKGKKKPPPVQPPPPGPPPPPRTQCSALLETCATEEVDTYIARVEACRPECTPDVEAAACTACLQRAFDVTIEAVSSCADLCFQPGVVDDVPTASNGQATSRQGDVGVQAKPGEPCDLAKLATCRRDANEDAALNAGPSVVTCVITAGAGCPVSIGVGLAFAMVKRALAEYRCRRSDGCPYAAARLCVDGVCKPCPAGKEACGDTTHGQHYCCLPGECKTSGRCDCINPLTGLAEGTPCGPTCCINQQICDDATTGRCIDNPCASSTVGRTKACKSARVDRYFCCFPCQECCTGPEADKCCATVCDAICEQDGFCAGGRINCPECPY